MEFDFSSIEEEVKKFWDQENVYRVELDPSRPKYYVLDMFPYPSGAGLHVGHPLGYIASDIYARYKRLKGYNVLHPMGYDSFGLPAEQYAIQTGQHPKITTDKNIGTFRAQMDKLGFSYDWSREVRTSDPDFYKWTQWIFIRLFHSWYNRKTDKAEPIETLMLEFARNGNAGTDAVSGEVSIFSAEEWIRFSATQKSDILLNYRLAYIADSWVNWCPALGTVLANDEVKDGVSERGGYPVERKQMKQWSLRITAYAERLLQGLETIDWSDSLKEAQRNWIGKSEGCSVRFEVTGTEAASSEKLSIDVFTTRPDTIFGATFLTLAPEQELVDQITADEYRKQVDEYVQYAKNRSERDRMADVKNVTGQFTGAYVEHPFSGKPIPVWIGEYVLATYGTGAVMGVPGHDERDHRFASHFGLPIVSILKDVDVTEKSFDDKQGILANSDFLNGLDVAHAISKTIDVIEKKGIGARKVNYKLRDAIFGRQRYWGEPIPIYFDDAGIPHTVDESDLPVLLPEVDTYLPTETGEPPLARATEWKYKGTYDYEHTTMPGWAGSSWYYIRYGDPHNQNEFASQKAINYWQNVDLYVGGDEHATGHLLYVRFWTKFLFDLGLLPFDEPAKKLVNQGKILGRSCVVARVGSYRNAEEHPRTPGLQYVSADILGDILSQHQMSTEDVQWIHLPVGDHALQGDFWKIDLHKLSQFHEDFMNGHFLSNQNGDFLGAAVTEKMSKRWHNVVNPNDVVRDYGADCFRLYEMFLGPLEQHKPWDTKGIDGCFRFLKRFWRLFYSEDGNWQVKDAEPANDEWKILHRTIKKVGEDIESMSFNTCVSALMICVNDLSQLDCHKRKVLEPLLLLLSPFAPFISEKLWQTLGHKESIVRATFPAYDASLLVESSFEYPVAVNGKTRVKMNFDLNLPNEQIEKEVLSAGQLQKYFEGKTPKKVIVVKGRIINVVV
jgi:leucyl-tRNA synthetase